MSAILNLTFRLSNSFENLQYNALLLFDLIKAFDCVDHDLLLCKLQYYKFTSDSIELVRSDFLNRVQVDRVEGMSSAEECVDVSVPQGSILGPILFLIYTNDIPT